MNDIKALRKKLLELKVEYRQLDDEIAGLSEDRPFNQLGIQRLKKRKLALKDEILQVETRLLPDIIA